MGESKAIVVGGGLGGIAAALRLRKKGYAVTLIEKQDQLGGRAYQWQRDGFTFDGGPTVITARFLFDELFELFGKKLADYVTLVDLYPWYRIRFADGTHFDYGGTLDQVRANIEQHEPDAWPSFLKYLDHSKRIFDVGFVKLGAVPFDSLGMMLRCAPAMMRLESYRSVRGLAEKYFKTEKLRRVFSFHPLLVGGNPFTTTSVYALIHFLERQWGVQYAIGGTGALVRALEQLMREEGIEIRLGHEVQRIRISEWKTVPATGSPPYYMNEDTPGYTNRYTDEEENKQLSRNLGTSNDSPQVCGVQVASVGTEPEKLSADLIIANADTPAVYKYLLPKRYAKGLAPRRVHSKVAPLKYSMSLFVLYFGTRKRYEQIPHHTIALGESYKELIHGIFDDLKLETKDLSVYLHRPTATDPSVAPPGCDSFYCLCPVPNNLSGINWTQTGPTMREAVLDYLERTHLPDLRQHLATDFYVTPDYYEKDLSTLHGTGFSIQPVLTQSAWFRFHNKAPGIKGLYFVGAGTHPGAGMPGVLCSAKIVEGLVPNPAAGR